MPRYLLQQWTAKTIRDEDNYDDSGHGVELWATPSTSQRVLELAEDDVIFVAAVVDGRLLPVSRLTVARVATYEALRAEGHDPYELPYQALAKTPLPRMNLRHVADRDLSLRITKEDGDPLARRRQAPNRLDGQAFRTPQWLSADSAALLSRFLDEVWELETDSGVDDPGRVSRGLAPHLSAAERRAVERRAMEVVAEHYEALGYRLEDVSSKAAWDLTATHPNGQEAHVEVKGTTGDGAAVTVTAGERRHAGEFARPVLAVVSRIHLDRGRKPAATGGRISVHLDPWDPSQGTWAATVYRYEPPQR